VILRKPYAFLIKNFRIIHTVLSILLIYIVYKTNNIYMYLRDYVAGYEKLIYNIETNVMSVGFMLYLIVFIVIGISIVIMILMNRKDKPTKYYLSSIIFYFLFIVVLLFTSSQIFNISQNQVNIRLVSAARDLMLLWYGLQYIFIIVAVIRAIGFNIKKFDFQNDLKELSVLSEDNEEFELDIELDAADVKTKFRRNLRIASYIIKENKKLFITIIISIILIISSYFGLNYLVYNRIYKEGQSFRIGDLKLTVLNSYETIYDYHLNDLSNNKNIYYVVEVEIKNNSDQKKYLSLDYVKLNVDEFTSYASKVKLYQKFIDIGQGYNQNELAPKSINNFIYVFEVDKTKQKNTKTFEVLSSITRQNDQTTYNYAKTKLEPKNLDNSTLISSAKLGEVLKMDDNLLGDLTLKIEEISFHDIITYEYEETINDKKYTFTGVIQPSTSDLYGKKILKLKTTINASNEMEESKAFMKFLGKYGHIRYIKDEKEYSNPFKITEVTPNNIIDHKYIEVLEQVEKADSIYLDIIIRDKKYTYVLK